MPFKKLFHVYERSIFMACVVLLSIAGLVFGVYPLIQKVQTLFADAKKLETENANLENKLSVLASVDENTLRTILHDLATAVPPDKSPATVLSTLDGVASTTQVTMENIQLDRPGEIATDSAKKQSAKEAKTGSLILPFSVTVNGEYAQIRSFLSTLANVRRLFRIRSAQITFADAVSVRAETEAYYVPYPVSIGSVAQPLSPLSDNEQQIIAGISALPLAYTENQFIGIPGAGPPLGKADPFSR